MDSLKIKLVPKEEEQEVDIQIKEEEKQHHVARDIKPFAGTIKSQIHYSLWRIHNILWLILCAIFILFYFFLLSNFVYSSQ